MAASQTVKESLAASVAPALPIFSSIAAGGSAIILRKDLLAKFESVKDAAFQQVIGGVQDAVVLPPVVGLAVRPQPGNWGYVSMDTAASSVKALSVPEYLKMKEEVMDGLINKFTLELDFEPFKAVFPRLSQSKTIGQGLQFVNSHLASKLATDKECVNALISCLKEYNYKGMSLMLNDKITGVEVLQTALAKVREHLLGVAPGTPYADFDNKFQDLGLKKGWGDTVSTVLENVELLLNLLEVPEPSAFEESLNVVIFFPHGYFVQNSVLGSTDDQIVCILDHAQVRALEDEMLLSIKQRGLDITPKILILTRTFSHPSGSTGSDPMEKIDGLNFTYVARYPEYFLDLWPCLESCANEILKVFKIKLDLIVERNFVWIRMARELGVAQPNVTHRHGEMSLGTLSRSAIAAALAWLPRLSLGYVFYSAIQLVVETGGELNAALVPTCCPALLALFPYCAWEMEKARVLPFTSSAAAATTMWKKRLLECAIIPVSGAITNLLSVRMPTIFTSFTVPLFFWLIALLPNYFLTIGGVQVKDVVVLPRSSA